MATIETINIDMHYLDTGNKYQHWVARLPSSARDIIRGGCDVPFARCAVYYDAIKQYASVMEPDGRLFELDNDTGELYPAYMRDMLLDVVNGEFAVDYVYTDANGKEVARAAGMMTLHLPESRYSVRVSGSDCGELYQWEPNQPADWTHRCLQGALHDSDCALWVELHLPHGWRAEFDRPHIVSEPFRKPGERWYGVPMAIHYRGREWCWGIRKALYTEPDEPMYHFDKQVDRWQAVPDVLHIASGVRCVAVVPDGGHDGARAQYCLRVYDATGALRDTYRMTLHHLTIDFSQFGFPVVPVGVTPD